MQRQLLSYYLEGLLAIVDELEQGHIEPSLRIVGASYFFSERTAESLGFQLIPPSAPEKINIYMNFFDLFWMYSFSRGRLVMPRLNQIRKVKATAADLAQHAQKMRLLHRRLSGA